MDVLPSGTLTMLFSDVEGSTSMLTRLGAQWGEALSAQRAILRAAFDKYGGHEMGTEGDSFFVVFTSAQDAVLAAVEAQRGLGRHEWPGDVQLRVRMGLHTGEPQRHEDGYIGLDVHRAARIMSTASGGQIVVSAATQALVDGVGALAASAAGGDDVLTSSSATSACTGSRTSGPLSISTTSAPRAWPTTTHRCAASEWLSTCPPTAASWWAGSRRWPNSSR